MSAERREVFMNNRTLPVIHYDEFGYKRIAQARHQIGHPCFFSAGLSDLEFFEEVGFHEFMKFWTLSDIHVLPFTTCFPLYEVFKNGRFL